MLSTDFAKQETVKQAKVLGVALNTMEKWISESVQIAHIERLATGFIQKDTLIYCIVRGMREVREIVPSLPSLPHFPHSIFYRI